MTTQPQTAAANAGELHSAIHDCWKKIGVYGDGSCPELVQHAHCRNCPVYSATAVKLLDRDLPAQYVADWTAHFAQAKTVVTEKSHSVLIFRIGVDWFALSTLILDEVAEGRTVRPLPHRRTGVVMGLVNVRGELIICISLSKMLGLSEVVPDQRAPTSRKVRFIVMRHEGRRMAFPVDEVQRTTRYYSHDLKTPPANISKAAANHTKGIFTWDGRLASCLDELLIIQTMNRSVA